MMFGRRLMGLGNLVGGRGMGGVGRGGAALGRRNKRSLEVARNNRVLGAAEHGCKAPATWAPQGQAQAAFLDLRLGQVTHQVMPTLQGGCGGRRGSQCGRVCRENRLLVIGG